MSSSRCYRRQDLSVFDLLEHPVWVFDITKKAMWWANTAAMRLWNAESLEDLLARSFSDDMSEATSRVLTDYLVRFREGERFVERWTYYPSGKGPTTVNVSLSGILIDDGDGNGRLAMLNEGDAPRAQEQTDQKALRGVEMLKHLPVAVGQFDRSGLLQQQNPEALDLFGSCDHDECTDSYACSFLKRFVDQELGRRVLTEVLLNRRDYCGEAQQHTTRGIRWFALKVRQSRDPVTAEPVILYSARDITEVINAKKEADQANIAKSEFLAVMAHEIRTPLHQVNGFIELLGQTQLTSQQKSYIDLLESSAMSLMAIINDLLDFTKLEAGKMKLEAISFGVKDVVAGSLAVVGSKAEEKGLRLHHCFSDDIPDKVLGDPNRLRQLLLNLLQNAIKFTHEGEITLNVSRMESKEEGHALLHFVLEDTGIGIGSDHLELIFDKYRQADASVARNYGGTGLGLAICKSLVENMGGSIGVDSEVGKGSKFWFQVPFQLPTSKDTVITRSSSPVGDGVSLNVLVAEDNVVNQKLAIAMLKRLGHEVTVVGNGLEAVNEVQKNTYDCVLMDVAMPVMDGMEATRRIRESGQTSSQLPVIGLTASFLKAELETYRAIGFNDCLGKPVRIKDLQRCLQCAALRCDQEPGPEDPMS